MKPDRPTPPVLINDMMATAQIPLPVPHLRRLHDALHCAHWISVYNPSWTVYNLTHKHPASQLPPLRPFVKLRLIKKFEIYEL